MKGLLFMSNEKYLIKNANVFGSYKGTFRKPAICPYCKIGTDAPYTYKQAHSFNNHFLFFAICTCTACSKYFSFIYEHYPEKELSYPVVYPPMSFTPYENKTLSEISPRFIDMYNQSLESEYNGHIELAAIGFRSSLEFLVKDFAIKELNKPFDEVSNKKLFDAISLYLKQEDLIKTADVVRILGNDYTHYKRKYPEHDFLLLKGYMDIFLRQIELEYMVKHPPVSRTP